MFKLIRDRGKVQGILGYEHKLNENNKLELFVKKHKKFFGFFNYINIFTGIVLILLMTLLFSYAVEQRINNNIKIPFVAPILPVKTDKAFDLKYAINENVPYDTRQVYIQDKAKTSWYIYLNIFYFIFVLFIVAGVHELGHLIYLYHNNIQAESFGFGVPIIFIIPLPLLIAFVREKEDSFKSADKKSKASVLFAGVFFNVLLFLLLIIPLLFFNNIILKLIIILTLGLSLGNVIFIGGTDGFIVLKEYLGKKIAYVVSGIFILGIIITFL